MIVKTPSKKCFKCGEIKTLSAFYRHPKMSDGHVNKCKECNKIDVRLNRELNQDYYTKYDKDRSREPSRYSKHLELTAKYTESNPLKKSATTAVNNAVRDGRIIRPDCCEYCGSTSNIQAHHSSYSKDMWLLVTWLCASCHAKMHRHIENKIGIYQ
jgi:hypothetical protein